MEYLNESTSKGNQPKFIEGDWFYKEDSMGYERAKKVLLKRLKETEVCYG